MEEKEIKAAEPVEFKQISKELSYKLMEFAKARNIGKTLEVDGEEYQLDYISKNSNAFFRSRGFSVYFKHKKSIIRISDHWSRSEHYERSRKLNCSYVSGKIWRIKNKPDSKIYYSIGGAKYPFELLAGKASLAKLNKECEHWR